MNSVTRTTRFENLPDLLSPDELRTYLGIGRTMTYELIRKGELPYVRYGRIIRIPREAIRDLAERDGKN